MKAEVKSAKNFGTARSRARRLRPEGGGRGPVPSASWPFSEKNTEEAGPGRQKTERRVPPRHLLTTTQQMRRTQGPKRRDGGRGPRLRPGGRDEGGTGRGPPGQTAPGRSAPSPGGGGTWPPRDF